MSCKPTSIGELESNVIGAKRKFFATWGVLLFILFLSIAIVIGIYHAR